MSAAQSNNVPLWVQGRDTVIAHSRDAEWRYGEPPDYTRSKENLAKESTHNHLEGSLEALVQNLVRTFEMEASFKTNPSEWLSVVNEQFRMSSNGGPQYTASDVVEAGTYNLFIGDTEDYKASEEDFESSANLFHTAFPKGFLWEVLEVYSGPPNVTFKWRHWGTFNGSYKDYAPTGERVEIVGMSVARVSDDLRVLSIEHYFDNSLFLKKLTAGAKKGTGEQQGSFWGFVRRLWGAREKQATGELQASRCPLSALIR